MKPKSPRRAIKTLHHGNMRIARKEAVHVRILAAQYTELAINTLATICGDRAEKSIARIMAAQVLLDRGWGKPTQPVEFEIAKWSDDELRARVQELMGNQVTGELTQETREGITTYVDVELEDTSG